MAVDIDRLVHIETAVGTPAERVQEMMRVFGAKAGEDDSLLVGFKSPLVSLKCNSSVLAATKQPPASSGMTPVGIKSPSANTCDLSACPSVGLKDEDLIGRWLTRLDLRIDLARSRCQSALGVEVHLDRLVHLRIAGPEFTSIPSGRMNVCVPARGQDRECLRARAWARAVEASDSNVAMARRRGIEFQISDFRFDLKRGVEQLRAGFFSFAISFSFASISGSNCGISTALLPCSCLRNRNRYVSFCGR